MCFERLHPSQANPLEFWMVMGVSSLIVVAMLLLFHRRRWI